MLTQINLKGWMPKNQYNGKGLIYQTGEVLADAMVQIATTKGIGGTLVKTGMGAKAAYATGVTASTMGQMAGGLYDQGLKMFDGDKRKAAQYAAMTGLAIGVGSNLFGVEARLAGGPGVFDNLTMGQVVKGLTPKTAAARTATNFFKEGAGEAFEETILEKGIEAATAMALNGDTEDIDLNEMKGTALISFAVGALMGAGDSDFKNSAWLVAAENPEEFKKALQAEVANGKKVDVEKMYNKALKIKGLSEIKEVHEEDIPKLDELTDLKDKAEKAKAIGADAQAKIFKEQAEAKEVEVFKDKKEEVVIPEDFLAEITPEAPLQEAVIEPVVTGKNLPAETSQEIAIQEPVEVIAGNLPAEAPINTPDQAATSQDSPINQPETTKAAPIEPIPEPKTIDQLGQENKSTYPKIPTNRVFSSPVSQPIDKVSVDKAIENEVSLPIEKVKASDVIPTQKNLTIDNLEIVFA